MKNKSFWLIHLFLNKIFQESSPILRILCDCDGATTPGSRWASKIKFSELLFLKLFIFIFREISQYWHQNEGESSVTGRTHPDDNILVTKWQVEIYQWEMWNVKRKICECMCWRLPISNQKYKRQLMKTNLLRQGNYKGRWLWEDLLNVWHDSLPCSVEWLCPMPMETTFTLCLSNSNIWKWFKNN